jgi:glycosyltransferase involved in cell wall biosynthesis
MKDVSIIIPVYNEAKVIRRVVQEVLDFKFSFSTEIIIVNDGSTDNSLEEVDQFKNLENTQIISNYHNRGYGASLKVGIRKAVGKYVCSYDGDGQFFPEDIENFYKKITVKDLDAVIGQREKLSSGSPLWRAPGKLFIRFLINSLIKVRLKDFNCGLRMLRRDMIMKYLHLCSDAFSFSTTSTMIIINRGYNYIFLPIKLKKRDSGDSSVRLSSGLSTIYLVLKMIMLFNPLKIFFTTGLVSLIFGFFWGLQYFLVGKGLSIGSLLFFIVGILLIFLGLIADQISEIRKSQYEK